MTNRLYNMRYQDFFAAGNVENFQHLITDITYGDDFDIAFMRSIIPGNIITFEKPNRRFDIQPTHIYYWIKPSLPKNTVNQLADPVEWIYVWRGGWDERTNRGGCYNGPMKSGMQNGNYNTVRHDLVEGAQLIPEQKPLSLILWLMELHTNAGDNVLDICAGAGTTLKAGTQLGRKVYGCEKIRSTYEIAAKRNGL